MNSLILLLVSVFISRAVPDSHHATYAKALRVVVILLTFLFICTLARYMFYPSYVDHIEPTLADLGLIFREGGAVYPTLDTYSLHGLLYGPGLTELQALTQLLPLALIDASKLPGVLPAAALALIFLFSTRSEIARGYLLLFFLFADAAIWNRADPLLGLAAYVAMRYADDKRGVHVFVVVGLLAGFCSSLKLHGVLYVVPALIIALGKEHRKTLCTAVFLAVSLGALALTFAPQQISADNFIAYLSMAGQHSIVPFMLFNNLCYLTTLTLPLILTIKQRSLPFTWFELLPILSVELLVAIIGAKEGAGTHHLLPAIFINAFLLDRALRSVPARSDVRADVQWRVMFLVGSLAVAFGLFKLNRTLTQNWDSAKSSALELNRMATAFPGGRLAPSDRDNYDVTFLRPLLAEHGSRQIEFAAYMDTAYSGLSDGGLVAKMKSCEIPFWFIPLKGEPFSLPNFYTGKTLVSADFYRHLMRGMN